MDRALIFAELKLQLKKKGIKYRHIAEQLNLSESSIKRIFSSASCSIDHLEGLCEIAGATLLEVMLAANNRPAKNFQLSLDEERTLSHDLDCFLFFRSLIIEKNFQRASKARGLDHKSALKLIGKLEKMNLVQFMPGDQLRFPRKGFLALRPDGELQRALFRNWLPGFTDMALNNDLQGYKTRVFSAELSEQLIEEFNSSYEALIDRTLKASQIEKLTGVSRTPFTAAQFQGPRRIGDQVR